MPGIVELLEGIDRDYDAQFDAQVAAFDDALKQLGDFVQRSDPDPIEAARVQTALLHTFGRVRRLIAFDDEPAPCRERDDDQCGS